MGVKSIVKIESSVELFCIFQKFYLLLLQWTASPNKWTFVSSRWRGTPSFEKIFLKSLYDMFKDTTSHRLVSLQFLSALTIFIGEDVNLSKDTISELCKTEGETLVFCDLHLSWKFHWKFSSPSEAMENFSVYISYFHQFSSIFQIFWHFLVTKKLMTSAHNRWCQDFFTFNIL